MSNITFKPLSKSHLDLLLAWLETPHVKAWWEQDVKWTMKLIEEKYGHYIKGYKKLQGKEKIIKKRMWAFTIFFEEIPIGYIQYYNVHDFPREQGDDTGAFVASAGRAAAVPGSDVGGELNGGRQGAGDVGRETWGG